MESDVVINLGAHGRHSKVGRDSEGSIDESRRPSDDGSARADADQSQTPPTATPDDMLVELLQSNYTEYHLPPDLALVRLGAHDVICHVICHVICGPLLNGSPLPHRTVEV